MLQETEIDSSASLLDDVDLAAGLGGHARASLLDRIHMMQDQGYDLSTASGTLELLVREALHPNAHPFETAGFEVTTRFAPPRRTVSAASVSVKVNGDVFAAQSTCRGPVEALDAALRECLAHIYPAVANVTLSDYLVHTLEPYRGAAATVGVMIEWSAAARRWTTMGVSDDIIEATWIALSSGVRLELLRAGEREEALLAREDDSWAV